jgi:hemolysin activation/secretion protein
LDGDAGFTSDVLALKTAMLRASSRSNRDAPGITRVDSWLPTAVAGCFLFGAPTPAIAASAPDLAIPSNPEPAATPRIFVREIRVVGNTVLSSETVSKLVAPFVGRFLDANDLETLRYRLTQEYVSRGYVNSGVVLPDQTAKDGLVSYQVIEGKLTGIDITGTKWLSPDYVRSRLEQGLTSPPNTLDIERRIQILLQDPNIGQLNAELVPDVAIGDARLRAAVTEAKGYSLTASIANDEPPNVGSVHGELDGVVRDLTGFGDTLLLRYGRTYGVNDGGVSWTIPVSAVDTALNFHWDYNGAGVVSAAFNDLNISTTTITYGASVSQPLYRTSEQTLSLSVALDQRASDTFLFNQPFSFTPGYVDGRASATIVRVGLDWVDRRTDQVVAIRSTVNRGLPIFGATNSAQQPNADFTYWLGQAQYVRAFGDNQIVARSGLQLSGAPLFPFEQLSIGGPDTVRGFPVNTLLTDNGVLLSLEARVPIARFRLPYVASNETVLRVAPFVDFASGWNTRLPTPEPNTLASIGIGLLWAINATVSAQIYYGHGFEPIRGLGHSLQEDGIYFRVASAVF